MPFKLFPAEYKFNPKYQLMVDPYLIKTVFTSRGTALVAGKYTYVYKCIEFIHRA